MPFMVEGHDESDYQGEYCSVMHSLVSAVCIAILSSVGGMCESCGVWAEGGVLLQ